MKYGNYVCSIIVPTYNRADLLRKTLESVLVALPAEHGTEVIVVDDGSSDETFSVTKSFESEKRLKYVYQPDEGYRAARARNLGIRIAEGDICLFVDCGVVVNTQFVRSHIRAHHEANSVVGLGHVVGIYQDPDEISWIATCDPRKVDRSLARHQNWRHLDPRLECFEKVNGDLDRLPMPWALAWTANLSVQREFVLASGGFDENYTAWGPEDLDLALNLSLKGATFRLIADSVALHIPHDVSEHNSQTNADGAHYMHRKYGLSSTQMLIEKSSIELNLQ